MKGFLTSAAALLSVAAGAAAQSTTTQSAPFYLIAHSNNATLNGTQFGVCHEGAAIESICIYNDDVFTFQLNTTSSQGEEPSSILTWFLQGSNFNQSEGLTFQTILSTNVAHPQFLPFDDGYASIAFDSDNRMYLAANYDDTVTPPTFSADLKLYNWFVCETNEIGYVYQTLDFVLGNGNVTPTNPTCQYVTVVREFA